MIQIMEKHLNLSGRIGIDLETLDRDITHLDISYCGLTSLKGLPNSVRYLRCSKNKITTLADIYHIPLISLGCSYNQLQNLHGCPQSIKSLICVSNLLSTLDGLPTDINKLYCSYNLITKMPNSNIDILDISCNLLDSLGGTWSVKELICSNNKLTNLYGCSKDVNILRCSDNPLSDFIHLLEISKNLTLLECLKIKIPHAIVEICQKNIRETFFST
jgi:Leucine-rich repeat (LRR) protein